MQKDLGYKVYLGGGEEERKKENKKGEGEREGRDVDAASSEKGQTEREYTGKEAEICLPWQNGRDWEWAGLVS